MRYFYLVIFSLSLFISCAVRPKPATPVLTPRIKVVIGEIYALDSISLNGDYTLRLEEAEYKLGRRNRKFYLSPSQSGFKIYNSNRLFVFTPGETILISPLDPERAFFSFNGRRYRGSLLLKMMDGKLLLINSLDLEEYLKCVVPAEMPSGKKEYLEALKAQAICARTYAMKKMLANKDRPFHLFNDYRDQEYPGLDSRTPLADLAVEQTRGEVLFYEENLAETYYNSTCGGISESSFFSWPGRDSLPYLPVQKDVIDSFFVCSISPLYRWQRLFTLDEIDSLFNKFFHRSLLHSQVLDTLNAECRFEILRRSPSGRVINLGITYADTSVELQNFTIRRFFSKFDKGFLPSLLFRMHALSDTLLAIEGGGFGHGVGMCQWGALKMSAMGIPFEYILVNHYYPGTRLRKVY